MCFFHAIPFLIILVCFMADQLSKHVILTYFSFNPFPIKVTPFLNFILTFNKGVSFGFLSSEEPTLFWGLTFFIGILIIWLLVRLRKEKNLFYKMPWALIIGGALGNFYDRITLHKVVDFIDVHYKMYHYATFNIADSLICIGALLLIIKDIRKKTC